MGFLNYSPNNIAPRDVNICRGLYSIVKLPVESQIMLRRSTSILDRLVKGAMVIVKKSKCPIFRREQFMKRDSPLCVLINFDDYRIGSGMKYEVECVAIRPATC